MAYTTTLTMTRLWVCERDNPTTYIACGSSGGGQRVHSHVASSTFETYGAGRRRQVSSPEVIDSHPITLMLLTMAQRALVRSWVDNSTQLLLRDVFAVRLFCGITRADIWDIPNSGGLSNITIDPQGVSFDESV
jgi:hypothetical protein